MDMNSDLPAWFREKLGGLGIKGFLNVVYGIEREGLRITSDGHVAQSSHPLGLGSALTHPWITTDYAESLIELVTPTASSLSELQQQLSDLHRYLLANIKNERLWPLSMPCPIRSEQDIAIAQYGTSNIAQMKHIYRVGLKHRYGSLMQIIAGVHFNWSLGEAFWQTWSAYQSQQMTSTSSGGYMHLVRNFYRMSWLTPYLFGASPAVHESFLNEKNRQTLPFTRQDDFCFLEDATSLRLSGLGYTNHAQDVIAIDTNSLSGYVQQLRKAIHTPSAHFAQIGVCVDGHYRQLNDKYLQLENELYTPIRPKCVAFSGEKPSDALASRGIEYVELRCCDVNPFDPVGMSTEQVYFYNLLLLHCLLRPSPDLDECEINVHRLNLEQTAVSGRAPHMQLQQTAGRGAISLRIQGERLLKAMQPLARCLDEHLEQTCYQAVLDKQLQKMEDPNATLSAQVLTQTKKEGFLAFGSRLASTYKEQALSQPYYAWSQSELEQKAQQSLLDQGDLERADTSDFDAFLRDYLQRPVVGGV